MTKASGSLIAHDGIVLHRDSSYVIAENVFFSFWRKLTFANEPEFIKVFAYYGSLLTSSPLAISADSNKCGKVGLAVKSVVENGILEQESWMKKFAVRLWSSVCRVDCKA
ncbi:hypothetical protein Tco_0863390 [Tanacetum coccineum]